MANHRWISATTLGDLLDRQAAERPNAPAAVFPNARVSYAELAALADHYAKALTTLGVGYRDRVGILLPASVDLLAILFGTAKIGAIAVPINARFKTTEITQLVVHSGMSVLITDDPPEFDAETPELRHIVRLGQELQESPAPEQQSVRVRDTAIIVYTSGTTAAPKGAMLSHEALTRLAAGIADRLAFSDQDKVWTPIPLFHGGGITFALSCVTAGATFVHPGFFDPGSTLELLQRERVTVALSAFETIWMPVLNRPDFNGFDLSTIRAVMVVGVPERLRIMAERLPHATQVSCVAMTESSAFLTLHELDDPFDARMTTGGKPMPGMLCRVVDPETKKDVPPGTEGELVFRGPNAFDGYFRDPEQTEQVFDEGGWFHSGDLVVADEEGRLTFRSRLKDMLKVGGENVAAAEVEGHLLNHPAVDIVAVVAAPDAHYVEVPAAFVQLKAGHQATERELIEFCLGKIATYRVPRYVRFIETAAEWPMSGTKIKKFVLRQRIADELEERGVTQAPRLRTQQG